MYRILMNFNWYKLAVALSMETIQESWPSIEMIDYNKNII